jgi:hypothetical protein
MPSEEAILIAAYDEMERATGWFSDQMENLVVIGKLAKFVFVSERLPVLWPRSDRSVDCAESSRAIRSLRRPAIG